MNISTARIGHCRVSTSDRNPTAQVAVPEAAGCTMIRTETGSGTSLENRPELGIVFDFIHPGETLVVTRVDRLARSMKALQVIVAKLRERGANIVASGRQKASSRRGRGASIADGLRRSTWTKSRPELRKGNHRPGLRARWGFRAEPSTRPRRESLAMPFKVPWQSGKALSRRRHEHRDLFAACSSGCPCVFGSFRPCCLHKGWV